MTTLPFGAGLPAYDLARLSAWVYEDRELFEVLVEEAGGELVETFDHAGTQAALVRAPAWAALVFRGTEATGDSWFERLVDFRSNLGVMSTLWAGPGRAHAGYAAALSRVRWDARRMAGKVSSDVPLYVTGHSLGGALASLYAAWVKADSEYGHEIAGLVTFGAPKAATAAAYEPIPTDKVLRFVMPMDFAPSWPPSLTLDHPEPEVRLDAPGWWPGPISRHSVGGYVSAVQAACAFPRGFLRATEKSA